MRQLRLLFRGLRRSLMVAAFVGPLAGCDALSIRVETSYGPGLRLDGLGSTFDWAPRPNKPTGDALLDNPSLNEFVRESMVNGFIAKGYEQAAGGRPDLWLDYRLYRKEEGDMAPGSSEIVYDEGSFVIFVIDPATKSMIWRGIAQARLGDNSPPPAKRQRIENTVKRMLAQFPDQGKG